MVFYPSSKKSLLETLDRCFDQTDHKKPAGKIRTGIAPHAGYAYSCPQAMATFDAIIGQKHPPQTIILIGTDHHDYTKCIDNNIIQTPLGTIPMDMDMTQEITSKSSMESCKNNIIHKEHSIDNQLPIIKYLSDKYQHSVSVVPIIFNEDDSAQETLDQLAVALEKTVMTRNNVAVVVSTDFMHHQEKNITKRRAKTLKERINILLTPVEQGNTEQLQKVIKKKGSFGACGLSGIKLLTHLNKTLHLNSHRLSLQSSCDISFQQGRPCDYEVVYLSEVFGDE